MLRSTLFFCITALLVPCANAQQQFISLHQFNKKLNLSYKSDGSVNSIDNLSGIKNLYDPTGLVAGGAPACVLGVPQFSSKCSLVAGSIGATISGTWDIYTQYKFYYPAGSTSTGLFAAMPQSTQYATIARMGTPPTRTTSLTPSEYQNAKRSMDLNTDFSRLLTGQEVIMVHDGSGNINPTGNGRFETHPMLKGYWVYVRVLNNDYVTNLSGATGLDLDIYTDWYKGMIASNGFKSDGDPQDTLSIPVRPTGIKLTSNAAVPGSTVSIQPLNNDAVIIGRCSIEPPVIAEQDIPAGKILTGVTISRYKVNIASNAVQGQYKVKCGDATDYSTQYAQYTPKFEAQLSIQDVVVPPPVYTLSLSAQSISLDNPAPVTVARSDGGDVGVCTFYSTEQGFNPTDYVRWDSAKKEISLRANAPSLPGDRQISVTCSSSNSPITILLKAKTLPSVFVPITSDVGFKPFIKDNLAKDTDFSQLKISYKNNPFFALVDFTCENQQYVDYNKSIPGVAKTIRLKAPEPLLPSSRVLSELTCSGRTSATSTATSWTANFYLSNASGSIQLLPPSNETKEELTKELSADGSIRLKGVAPKAATDTDSLTVWFGVELKDGEKYALVLSDVSKKNEWAQWAPGIPDSKPGTKVKHEGTNDEFSFDLAGITQAAIDAYKKSGGTIKGTVFYQFGSGVVRQLNTAWMP